MLCYSYWIDNDLVTPIERVETIKDLGILMDEKLSFKEHIHDKIPTLHYRRIRGYMIETFNINWKYDMRATPTMLGASSSVTRGHNLRLNKFRVKYDLRKYYFTNRVVNVWNCL